MKQSQNWLEIAVLGNERVGKTYFINRISKSRAYHPQIGVLFYSKEYQIHEKYLRVTYWDLPRSRDWIKLLKRWQERINLFIIVYDVTSRSSFESVEIWRNKINQDIFRKKILF
ncbi:unnamed protein product [Blepharisma stoltei]|uniref:GTP-binding protein n=1 Tax=Blepharisma stoltei TaxID=1481888 RepID=A0AAU9KBC3_9CILI|nr:unnamed protein product [Blepharisma stoltei]